MCDVNGPIATPDARERIGQVLAKAGIATYAFSGWPNVQARRGLNLRKREGSAMGDLSRRLAAWREAQRDLHPKHFKKMRRLARQGEKDFGAETVTFGPASAEDLAKLIDWQREQFRRTRRHDVLGAAWTRGLLEACAAHQGDRFAGVMATLRYDGRLAAAAFGLRSGRVLHGWIAGGMIRTSRRVRRGWCWRSGCSNGRRRAGSPRRCSAQAKGSTRNITQATTLPWTTEL